MTSSWRSRLPASPRSPPLSPRFTAAELDLELQPNPKLFLRKKQRKQLGYRTVVHEFGLTGPVIGAVWIGICLFGLLSFEKQEVRNAMSIHSLLDLAETSPREITADLEPRLVVHRGELRVEASSIADREVGIRVSRSVLLQRRVEMYQYIKPNMYQYSDVSGDVHSVPSEGYQAGWSEKRIHTDSEQYSNPKTWRIDNLDLAPAEVFLGQFALCPEMRASLEKAFLRRLELEPAKMKEMTPSSEWQLLAEPDPSNAWKSTEIADLSLTLHDDGFIYSGNPRAPKVGDLRIHYMYSPTENSFATALGELVVEEIRSADRRRPSLSLDTFISEEVDFEDGNELPKVRGRLKPYPMRELHAHGAARRLDGEPEASPQDFTLATPVAEALHLDRVFPLLSGRRRTTVVSNGRSAAKIWSIAMIDVGVIDAETLVSKYIQNHSSIWEGTLARALFVLGICIGSMFAVTPAVAGVFFPFPLMIESSQIKNMLWLTSALIATGIVCIVSAVVHTAESPRYALAMALLGGFVFLSLRKGALLLIVQLPWERLSS
uniref:Transmembrane protein 43 n=1 Tax=Pinguiococcus pyrenoidosus TaxID=172671 RepID=A0A7R9U3B6_9STRA|mmetsp:Transcript_12595/g.46535  ORF Transcript_12595/g.46535 Transcript_12595/m.46535 type:complete len:547 (+) Transcript_12595:89-1729(+)